MSGPNEAFRNIGVLSLILVTRRSESGEELLKLAQNGVKSSVAEEAVSLEWSLLLIFLFNFLHQQINKDWCVTWTPTNEA